MSIIWRQLSSPGWSYFHKVSLTVLCFAYNSRHSRDEKLLSSARPGQGWILTTVIISVLRWVEWSMYPSSMWMSLCLNSVDACLFLICDFSSVHCLHVITKYLVCVNLRHNVTGNSLVYHPTVVEQSSWSCKVKENLCLGQWKPTDRTKALIDDDDAERHNVDLLGLILDIFCWASLHWLFPFFSAFFLIFFLSINCHPTVPSGRWLSVWFVSQSLVSVFARWTSWQQSWVVDCVSYLLIFSAIVFAAASVCVAIRPFSLNDVRAGLFIWFRSKLISIRACLRVVTVTANSIISCL